MISSRQTWTNSSPRVPASVSVVIPAYNVAPYIREAVFSVLNQSFGDFELVLVDDGSTDRTAEQLADIQDPRVTIIRQPNQGLAAARNAGVAVSRSPHIAFLDGDDVWTRDKLQRHIEVLKANPDIDLTFSHSAIIDEIGRRIWEWSRSKGGTVSFSDLAAENLVRNGSAVVLRREALRHAGCFDTSLAACSDYDMWLRIASQRTSNAFCIPEVLTLYRRRPDQLTSDWKLLASEWEILFGRMEQMNAKVFQTVRGAAEINLYRYLAYLAYDQSDYRTGLSLLVKGMRLSPLMFVRDLRNGLAIAACLTGLTWRGLVWED